MTDDEKQRWRDAFEMVETSLFEGGVFDHQGLDPNNPTDEAKLDVLSVEHASDIAPLEIVDDGATITIRQKYEWTEEQCRIAVDLIRYQRRFYPELRVPPTTEWQDVRQGLYELANAYVRMWERRAVSSHS